jgi:5-methylcytosine-specific restriction endonuclease McrA
MPRSKGRTGRPWQRIRQHVIDTSDGICAWCHRPVDRTLPGTHPWGPTADHIIELDRGGPERDPANLQLMHRRCNNAKEAARRRRGNGGGGLNPGRRW